MTNDTALYQRKYIFSRDTHPHHMWPKLTKIISSYGRLDCLVAHMGKHGSQQKNLLVLILSWFAQKSRFICRFLVVPLKVYNLLFGIGGAAFVKHLVVTFWPLVIPKWLAKNIDICYIFCSIIRPMTKHWIRENIYFHKILIAITCSQNCASFQLMVGWMDWMERFSLQQKKRIRVIFTWLAHGLEPRFICRQKMLLFGCAAESV